MHNPSPTIQQLLLDHLRRIVEMVSYTTNSEGKIIGWEFGVGDDCLMSDENRHWPDDVEQQIAWAHFGLLCSTLGVEAQDGLGSEIPERLVAVMREFFKSNAKTREFLEEALPSDADERNLQLAFAYEMLQKLDGMVERTRQGVQEKHLLKGVPINVDLFVKEAASCFRYGFYRATASLCRSSLEGALRDKLGDTFSMMLGEDGRKTECPLIELINRAVKLKILDRQFAGEAHFIRTAANASVHGKSGDVDEEMALEVLTKTRFLLTLLYPPSD